jgi:uncharacterized damage-inducible protein DinB
MPHCAATLEELLADFNLTATRWQAFFAENPEAANAPTDIARSTHVAELVWHMYAASYRHSERLLGLPVTDLEGDDPPKDLESAWKLHATASENLAIFLAQADEEAFDRIITFQTRSAGEISGTYRKLCLHVFVHAIRHWAQIGPIVRQHGYTPTWPQDIFFTTAIP